MADDDIDLSVFETDELIRGNGAACDWPMLADWTALRYGADVCLEGRVNGHPRLADGGAIRTSALRRLTRDRTYAQTRNTIYRLGAPATKPLPDPVPDVIRLICCPHWDAARALLAGWTRQRAEALSDVLDTLGGLVPWSERRALIAVIRRELSDAGQHRLGDIWDLLATDARELSSCRISANTVGAAYDEWSSNRGGADDAFGRRMQRIVNGWQALADERFEGRVIVGKTMHEDPIALARELGEMLADCEDDVMKDDANEREAALLEKASPAFDPAQALQQPRSLQTPGLIVIAKIGGNQKIWNGKPTLEEFRPLEGMTLPLAATPDLVQARATLVAEFPHAPGAIDIMLSDLIGQPTATFRPTLFAGEPGGGKSRLAARIAEVIGLHVARYDASASNDSSFAGCARHWSSAEPSFPLAAVRDSGTANPLCMIDEIDKASNSPNNGGLAQALLPLLERETSAKYPDVYIQSQVNLSAVSHILTANSELLLPKVLRDRLRLIRIPVPTVEHLPALARTIIGELTVERGVDAAWVAPLDGDEIHIAAGLWPGGSIRRLRAIIERLLARRDEQAPRH